MTSVLRHDQSSLEPIAVICLCNITPITFILYYNNPRGPQYFIAQSVKYIALTKVVRQKDGKLTQVNSNFQVLSAP